MSDENLEVFDHFVDLQKHLSEFSSSFSEHPHSWKEWDSQSNFSFCAVPPFAS
jgi:hypothetical protein